ncbi:hypothetical protein Ahy_B06g085779 [Arachis hypogaea]|uniref:Aminotransferase-like plant mobile domain-containing protein n=1 Tax=Arachis hypogaea TaxID=3818 RepID=A0A444YVP9_ARAHY|nr:hypothetical protein Ahy_B06g085779 [Arachis hypogaea]
MNSRQEKIEAGDMEDDPNHLYRLDGVVHIAGTIHLEASKLYCACYDKEFSIVVQLHRCISSMRRQQETFSELLQGADDETVRRYARAYITMILSTQLFGNKSGTRLHIRWLPYVARLEDMGQYSWGSAALSWLFRCMCRVVNRNVVKLAGPLQLFQSWIFWRFPSFRPERFDFFHWPLASKYSPFSYALCYQPTLNDKGPRVSHWRLRIDLLQHGDLLWMPYSLAKVVQVVHPEILEPRHMSLNAKEGEATKPASVYTSK